MPAAARAIRPPTAARAARPSPAPAPRLPLGLPLDAHQLRRLAELEQLVGARYQGWGWEPEANAFFVDVLERGGERCSRHYGETLHGAIGEALRAERRAA